MEHLLVLRYQLGTIQSFCRERDSPQRLLRVYGADFMGNPPSLPVSRNEGNSSCIVPKDSLLGETGNSLRKPS